MLFALKKNNFFKNNKEVLLVFFVTLTVFSIIFSYQIINYEQNLKGKSNAGFLSLITGDEPHYLSLTSNILYHQNVFLENHFTSQFSGVNKDPFMTWPENFNNPTRWHAEQREDGHWVIGHGPGISFVMLPGYAVAGIYGAMMTIALVVSSTSVLIFKFSKKFTSKNIAILTSILFSFSTLLLVYSNTLYSDVLMMGIVFFSIYCIFEKRNKTYLAIAGMLLGFGIFLKISFVLFDIVIIPLVFFLAFKKKIKWENISIFVVFFLILTGFAILNNISMYDNWIGGERTESALSVFLVGRESTSGAFSQDFSEYRLDVLIEIFFGKFHGLFIFSPIIMLFVLGIKGFLNKDKVLAISLLLISFSLIAGHLFFEVIFSIIGGDPPFRYFIVLIPFMSIPFAIGLQNFSKSWIYRTLFGILLLPSVLFSIAFASLRHGSLAHIKPKEMIISAIYQGIDGVFPSLGPHEVIGRVYLHHPLTIENLIFIIIMTGLLFIGVFIPYIKIK